MIIKLHGQAQLERILNRFPDIVGEEAEKGLARSGFEFEKVAKPNAHVDTGRYRASICHFTSGDVVKENPNASPDDSIWILTKTSLQCGSNVEYALDLEKRYGNFQKSLEETAPKMEGHLRTAYEVAIGRIARQAGSVNL